MSRTRLLALALIATAVVTGCSGEPGSGEDTRTASMERTVAELAAAQAALESDQRAVEDRLAALEALTGPDGTVSQLTTRANRLRVAVNRVGERLEGELEAVTAASETGDGELAASIEALRGAVASLESLRGTVAELSDTLQLAREDIGSLRTQLRTHSH